MEEVFRRLFEACVVRSLPKEKQQKYQRNMTTKRDYENILYTAELRGEKRGREEGMDKTKMVILKKMTDENADPSLIKMVSELSRDEILDEDRRQ